MRRLLAVLVFALVMGSMGAAQAKRDDGSDREPRGCSKAHWQVVIERHERPLAFRLCLLAK